MPPESLEEIVEQSVKEAPDAIEKSGAIKPEETEEALDKVEKVAKTIPSDKEEDEETEEKDEFGFTVQEQLEARQLLAALRDPTKAPEIIKFLAENAGYKKGDLDTPKKTEAAKKDLVTELKEALGEELAYIADKMGPVIEKRLKEMAEESTADIREDLSRQRDQKLMSDADRVQDSLGKRFFEDGQLPTNLVVEMTKTMDRLKPAEDQTLESYMEDILYVAAQKLKIPVSETSKSKAEKILKNRSDAPSRLASDRTRPKQGETAVPHPKRQMTLAEAVQAANEQTKTELTK